MRQYVLIIILSIVLVSCSRRITNINCEVYPINKQELHIVKVRDSFYVEDIRMEPSIVNFNNSGTDSFFRMFGPYIVKEIESQIDRTYENGVFINDLSIYEFRDILADSISSFEISEKLENLKQNDIYQYYYHKNKILPRSKKSIYRYSRHYLELKYIFLGDGCIFIPDLHNKKGHRKRIRVPIYLVVDVNEI